MTSLDIESLLQPLSAEAPCGANMEYQPPFMELEELARGKPEQVIGDKVKPAQDPDWDKVQDAAVELFTVTKDLRIAGWLHMALLKLHGLQGLCTGLALLRGLVERHWDSVYPRLDPDDDNDPTRVNSLMAALASEDVLSTLRVAPLVTSRQFGRVTLRNQRIAAGTIKVVVDGESADASKEQARIDAAFADVGIEALSGTAVLLNEVSGHLNALQQQLLLKADGVPESVNPLLQDVKEIQALVASHLTKRGGGTTVSTTTSVPESPTAPPGGSSVPGVIRNSTDVLAALQSICDYYARAEPSSPVPLLLKRASRLVNKDFMAILKDLAPGGVSEAEVIGGVERRDD